MKKILVFLTLGIVIIVMFNLSQINPNQNWVDTNSGGYWRTNPNGITSDNIGENKGDIAMGIFFLLAGVGIFIFFNTRKSKDSIREIPEWTRELPQHLRPSNDQIRRLEEIRNRAGISNSEFFMHISSHPETTHRLQRYLYDVTKKQQPSCSEKDVLKMLLLNRLILVRSTFGEDAIFLGIPIATSTNEQVLEKGLQDAVEAYPSLKALSDAIIQWEREADDSAIPTSPELENIAQRISEILKEFS